MLLLLDNLEQVIEAAPDAFGARAVLSEPGAVSDEPRAPARAWRSRVRSATARLLGGRLALLRALTARTFGRDHRTLRPPRRPPARGRARRSTDEGAVSRADPRPTLRSPRPAERRQRRRRSAADAQGDDRVELRPPLAKRSSGSSERSPSSPVAARWTRPRRSPEPTSTRCSRSSRRASCASRTSATGCWRRSASTPARSSSRIGEAERRQAAYRVLPRSGRGAAGSGWTTDLRRATRALHGRSGELPGSTHAHDGGRRRSERCPLRPPPWSRQNLAGLPLADSLGERRSPASPCPGRRTRIVRMRLSGPPAARACWGTSTPHGSCCPRRSSSFEVLGDQRGLADAVAWTGQTELNSLNFADAVTLADRLTSLGEAMDDADIVHWGEACSAGRSSATPSLMETGKPRSGVGASQRLRRALRG